MSYVLEALKKADAERERERGAVPDIHAQPASWSAGEPVERRRPASTWTAMVLALAASIALTWYLASPAPRIAAEPPSGASAARPVTAFVPAAAAPGPVAPNAAASAAATVPTAPLAMPAVPSTSAAPAATTRAAAPATARKAARDLAPNAARTARAAPAAQADAAGRSPSSAGSPDERSERIYARGQLPDEVRRQLPPLTISGSMYSAEPSGRMLFVNGRVLREGDRVAPDLTLQQIRLKTAVFLYKTYRYEQGY